MTEEVGLWRIYCIEEGINVEVWSKEVPTLCPHDHSNRSVDPSLTRFIKFISTQQMKIENNVTGIYQSTTIPFSVPSGANGSTYTHDISFPFDIYIWMSNFVSEASMVGDELSIIIGPDSTVGYITAAATTGDTTLSVSNTVLSSGYVTKGVEMAIDDGVNYNSLGLVTAVDMVNNIITYGDFTRCLGVYVGCPTKKIK